jgi:predicted ATPase/DNA-binding SARP family transcriptional activator
VPGVAYTLTVSVLGPLRVAVDGRHVPLGERGRALLGALVARRGQAVPRELLVELVWPDGGPGGGRNALQALVSRTRRALGPAGAALVTVGEAYRLDVPPEAVDAERLEHAVELARGRAHGRGQPSSAGAALAEVLRTWRGDPYLDVADDPAAVAAASRLTELRREAVDLHAEAILHAGGGAGLIADLRAWTAEAPLRERTHRALALALYRADRQAEALEVLAALRRRLRDELGLDPAPDTDALHQALLRRAADLDPPDGMRAAPHAMATGPTGPSPARRDHTHHLPPPRTSFVGRDAEVAALHAALDHARLVTLVGPGGTGKTRLAVEALRGLTPPPRDGVALVELAPVTDPDDVLQHVAVALDIDPEPGGTQLGVAALGRVRRLEDRIRDRVRDTEAVVLLDNCEHLVDAAADLAELLLDAGPDVRIVATSREGLRVAGERLQPVPPLAVPPAPTDPLSARSGQAGGPEVAALLDHDAVRLFVERATAAEPAFRLDATTAPAVVEVCRRSDGLPLALELAAARVSTLPVTELAARLEDRFRLLTGGRRTVRRQQTLEAVVAWSYDLLDARQRWLLRRLAVFAGPVAVELVEAVVAAEGKPSAGSPPTPVSSGSERPAPDEVLPVLLELAERSLLTLEPVTTTGPDGEPSSITTVRLLETIRAFAQERLTREDDAAAVRTAHANVLAERARTASVAIRGPEQLAWLEHLDRELDELRAALSWWLRTEPVRAVAMAGDLGWYWWLHDLYVEGARWLEESLARAGVQLEQVDGPGPEPDDRRPDLAAAAIACGWLGFLHLTDNRIEAAAHASARARRTLAWVEDPSPFVAGAVPLLAAYVDALTGGDPRAALSETRAVIERADAVDEHWVVAAGCFVLTGVLVTIGEHEQALAAGERALDAAARSGDRWAAFQTRSLLAFDLNVAGRYTEAAEHLAAALPLARAIGSRGQERLIRVQQATVCMLAGDPEAAEHQLTDLLASGPVHGRDISEGMIHQALGMARRRRGDVAGAIDAYRRAAGAYDASDEVVGAAEALAGLTHAEVAGGDLAGAAAAMAGAVERVAGYPAGISLATTVPLLHEAAADLACARGDPDTAMRHLGRAGALREVVAAGLVAGERFDLERIEAAARAGLTATAAEAAWSEGRETAGLLPPLD